MFVKRLYLENIRSFVNQEILLKEGISLLAGDIGSGKSTILLVIDFALFGIRRGELNGSTLLRNGAAQGSVEVEMVIAGKNILIKRVLKRGINGITQDFGFLSVNGVGHELTAGEMKQQIITLLNYPQESVTKKSFIYKYTVYTPQEEMKEVLSGGKEERLETLRKIFSVDKYRRIVENAKIVTVSLREKKKECAGRVYDYEEKKMRLENVKKQQTDVEIKITEAQHNVLQTQKILGIKKTELQQWEEQQKQWQDLQNKYVLLNTEMKHKQDKFTDLQRQAQHAQDAIARMIGAVNKEHALVTKTEISSYETIVQNAEENLRGVVQKVQDIRTKHTISRSLLESVVRLDVCPTCKQKVGQEYKDGIHQTETQTIAVLEAQLKLLQEEELKTTTHLKGMRQELVGLREKEKQVAVWVMQQQEAEKQRIVHKTIADEQEKVVKEIAVLEEQRKTFVSGLASYDMLLRQGKEIAKEVELLHGKEKESVMLYAAFEQERKSIARESELVEKELQVKERIRDQIIRYDKIQQWMEDQFVVLMQDIERKVLLRVHHDLNQLLRSWFQKLIDNESMSIRLDEEFTPVIEQNGYDTSFENLSGGEKTAASLAYRLALNQVINNLVTTLNTRDLLILDEPTDGFSVQQVEKMREVLRELKVKQMIIVSHEQQMESFVDQIIRLEKKDHMSSVNY